MTRIFTKSLFILALCGAVPGPALAQKEPAPQLFPDVKPDQIAVPQVSPDPAVPAYAQTPSGNYLSSMFAQRHHDWSNAKIYLNDMLDKNPDDPALLKRAMILAVGSGEIDLGMEFARRALEAKDAENSLAYLFLATDSFQKKNYQDADSYIAKMPNDSLSEFIVPLLKAWSQAAVGVEDVQGLDKNIIHINHAVLIADYLKQYDGINKLLEKALKNPEISTGDILIIADVYAHTGAKDKALPLYQKAQKDFPDEPVIAEKIKALDAPAPMDGVNSPQQGMAMALLDMAKLLYQEYSDDSARVFAHLALYLDPTLIDADLLLASVTARNERYEEAIDYYRKVTPDSPYFLESRRKAADLLLDAGRQEEALSELKILADEHGDLNSLIRIGDVYRQNEQFEQALDVYNQAAKKLGPKFPPEYWYLHYVRGICYERAGHWPEAEKDLKAALSYQPDHPYVLNYLGYAWADQGVNLKEALGMVERASTLMPEDGYITDSLGWVYYKMAMYEDSAQVLEGAVQLLPEDAVINDHLGDAYWRTGRKREAAFQWQRAANYTKDATLKAAFAEKIAHGLSEAPVAQAHGEAQLPPEKTATP